MTTTPTSTPAAATVSPGASGFAAAAFIAGIAYMWIEAAIRLIFTQYPTTSVDYVLWNGRVGDIAAMWLTMGGVSALIFLALAFGPLRGKQHVGTIRFWTALLLISAVAAPLIGEIGTPSGI